jgi:hypothetical protein
MPARQGPRRRHSVGAAVTLPALAQLVNVLPPPVVLSPRGLPHL